MRHRQELVPGDAPLLGHRAARDFEDVRDDRGRGHRVLRQQDAVEHTARRAGPSVADAGDDGVAGFADLRDELLVRGDGRVVLAVHPPFGDTVLRFQNIADLREEPVRVELRVLDEADALAFERCRPVDVRDGLRRDPCGGIEELDHRLTSLVTAWELRLLDHPGMYAENAPARPPAATTRMSSGEAMSGRSFASSPGSIGPDMRAVRLRCAWVFCVCSKTNRRMSFLPQPSLAIVRMCSPASTIA